MKELAIGETGIVAGKLVKCVASEGCLRCCFHDDDCSGIMCADRRDGKVVMFISSDSCIWKQDTDGIWHTSCGQAREFTTGTPEENQHLYCPYCGNVLEAKEYE